MATAIFEVTWSGTLAGQFVQTVQHVKATIATPINPFAEALQIAQGIDAAGINTDFMACLPSDYKLTSLRVKQILPTGGPTAILLPADLAATVGQRSGEISSAQVNPVMIWIPTTEPAKTGRLFFPGVSEDDIDEMALTAALVLVMNNFAVTWINGGTLGGVDSFVGCVLRKSTGAPPHLPVSGDVIFAGQISPLIGTQRRRLHPV